MSGTPKYGLPYPQGSDRTDVPAEAESLADAIDLIMMAAYSATTLPAAGKFGRIYRLTDGTYHFDVGTGWEALAILGTDVNLISPSAPGDTASLGTSPLAAPLTHKHAREAGEPFAIPFHISSTLSTGLKIPKWIAPFNGTIKAAYAELEAGSGARFQVWINGQAPTGMVDSAAVGTGTTGSPGDTVFDFTDFNVNLGDRVQIKVTNAGTSASDLSVTLGGVTR